MSLTIIGTSHIAAESVQQVRDVILSLRPHIVAVELDQKRLVSLLQKGRRRPSVREGIRQFGLQGYLFSLLGEWLEHKLGQQVGVLPGSEMLAAVHAARETNARLLLLDQDIQVTLRQFSQRITWKEKFRFAIDLFKGLFGKEELRIDPSKVPPHEVITTLLRRIRARYPNVYDVLVHKRNHVMAKKLASVLQAEPTATIVAVVGAGHEKAIRTMIEKTNV